MQVLNVKGKKESTLTLMLFATPVILFNYYTYHYKYISFSFFLYKEYQKTPEKDKDKIVTRYLGL